MAPPRHRRPDVGVCTVTGACGPGQVWAQPGPPGVPGENSCARPGSGIGRGRRRGVPVALMAAGGPASQSRVHARVQAPAAPPRSSTPSTLRRSGKRGASRPGLMIVWPRPGVRRNVNVCLARRVASLSPPRVWRSSPFATTAPGVGEPLQHLAHKGPFGGLPVKRSSATRL